MQQFLPTVCHVKSSKSRHSAEWPSHFFLHLRVVYTSVSVLAGGIGVDWFVETDICCRNTSRLHTPSIDSVAQTISLLAARCESVLTLIELCTFVFLFTIAHTACLCFGSFYQYQSTNSIPALLLYDVGECTFCCWLVVYWSSSVSEHSGENHKVRAVFIMEICLLYREKGGKWQLLWLKGDFWKFPK